MVLREVFRLKRVQVTTGRRKLHDKTLHNFYFSPTTIRVTESRII